MTAVLLPGSCTTSAIHTAPHGHRRTENIGIRFEDGSTPRQRGGGGTGAAAGEHHRLSGGGLHREPLGVVDRNMSQRRQAKVVVDYNEVSGKKGVARGKGGDGGNVNGSVAMGKRKAVDYEEDIEGFQFSRAAQSKRSRSSDVDSTSHEASKPVTKDSSTPSQGTQKQKSTRGRPPKASTNSKQISAAGTPNGKPADGPRKSKRLADDATTTSTSKPSKTRRKLDDSKPSNINVSKKRSPAGKGSRPPPTPQDEDDGQPEDDEVHTEEGATKIALPMADTPVIRRNKEMRQEKGKKGQRRSSLSMRGRRASSLIESGASNALPHDAVGSADFYKHIEGEGLPEPRRMKQLLTWCATRALGKKPSGSRSEDESARLAARVIQEELLKEIGARSELSDWFGREETSPPPVVVKKPNPKNTQNADKIKELEDHIQRLQSERQSLNALLKAPSIPPLTSPPASDEHASSQNERSKSSKHLTSEDINSSLLDSSQQALLATLTEQPPPSLDHQTADKRPSPSTETEAATKPSSKTSSTADTPASTSLPAISSRLSSLSLAPSLDSFAGGVHDIELFRRAADNLAGSILGTCAHRLEERDLGNRAKPPGPKDEDRPPEDEHGKETSKLDETTEQEDLSLVLAALSRLERR